MSSLALSILAAGFTLTLTRTWLGRSDVGIPVACAATAYFLVNSGLVSGAVGLTRRQSPWRFWRDTCLMTAPGYYVCAIGGAFAAVAVQRPRDALVGSVLLLPVYLTYRGYRAYIGQLHDRQREAEEASALNLRITEALTLAISARDGASHESLRALQEYGARLAAAVGLDTAEQRAIALAVLLRDIGKLTVPQHILTKAGPLTAGELQKVRSHPDAGAAILGSVGLPPTVLAAIQSHHERWDGSGYPLGLRGQDTPLAARILALLDRYDELAQAPATGPVEPPDAILAVLAREAGVTLDPVLVAAFIEMHGTDRNGRSPASAAQGSEAAERSSPRQAVLEDIAMARREADALYDIADILGSSLGLRESLDLVAPKLAALVPFSRCTVHRYDPQSGTMRLFWATHAARRTAPADASRTAVTTDDSLPFASRTHEADARARSALMVPLVAGQDLLGTLAVTHADADVYGPDDLRRLHRVTEHLARSVASVRRLEEAQKDALTDPLTGLANRRSLIARAAREIERARCSEGQVGLLLADVDDFKTINDSLGHRTGDRVLVSIAEAMQGAVRASDTCVRYAGDEFVVLLPGCGPAETAARGVDLQHTIDALELTAPGGPFRLGVSVGAATFPADGESVEALVEAADRRMYDDKLARKQRRLEPHPPGHDLPALRRTS